MPKPRELPLQTVDRALQVLMSYDEARTSWGVSELAKEMRLNTSTSQRLLAALAARGFLASDPYTRRYSLGPAMWRMAALWERSGGLARLAEGVLADLAAATGRTAAFTVPDGSHVRCVAAVDGRHGPVRAHPLVGDIYPAHAGAVSRAYFAFLDPAERRSMLAGRPFGRFSELTQVDEPAVWKMFEETQRQGWAYSEGEFDPSTRAIAAPVYLGANPVGSISLLEPKVPQHEDDIQDHVDALLQSADTLADRLAYRRRPGHRDFGRGQLARSAPSPEIAAAE